MDLNSDDDYSVDVIPPPILKIKENPSLSILKIDYTILGDDGCRRLFRWLRTGTEWESNEEGTSPYVENATNSTQENKARPMFPRRLSHLEMNRVAMGDVGFDHLIDWLRCLQAQDRTHGQGSTEPMLKTLVLRNNKIEGTSQSAERLVSTILCSAEEPGSPSLRSLSLSNNPLSAPFRQTLFSLLPTLSSLRSLQLSLTRIQPVDMEALIAYIGGSRSKCKLTEFIASGNNMGYRGVRSLIDAMEHNWSLEKVNMFGNDSSDEVEGAERSEDQTDYDRFVKKVEADLSISPEEITTLAWGSGCGPSFLESKLKMIVGRNILLKRQVKKQALDLLKYSRLMLHKNASPPVLASQMTSPCSENCECIPPLKPPSLGSPNLHPPFSSFSFLPTELQLSILSEMTPLLSSAQRIRIFEYAADKATLPKLQLYLPGRDNTSSSNLKSCIVDPINLGFNSRSGKKVGNLRSRDEARRNACAGGNCFGSDSVVCRRQIERHEWLELVGCDAYDPGDTV